MFARFATLLSIAALATSVVAAPGTGDYTQCKGGAVKCCNQPFKGTTPFDVMSGKDLIGAAISAVADAGLQCNPIGVIAIGSGAQCQEQTACCTGEQDGLVNVQCVPLGINAA